VLGKATTVDRIAMQLGFCGAGVAEGAAVQKRVIALRASPRNRQRCGSRSALLAAVRGAATREREPRDVEALSRREVLRNAAAGALALGAVVGSGQRASAFEGAVVGQVTTSGMFFKDTLAVTRFPDPKVQGVQLYVTDFERPLTERIQKNFFAEPARASLACVRTGPISLAADVDRTKNGEEVLVQSKNLLTKSVRVRRFYDEGANALVYVSYAARINKDDDENKSRFSSDMCVVPLD